MSIINEALKKTQAKLSQLTNLTTPATPTVQATPATPQPSASAAAPTAVRESRGPWFWVMVILVFIGFFGSAAALVYITLSKPKEMSSFNTEPITQESSVVKAAPVLPPAHPPAPASETKATSSVDNLTLNGIIAMDGDHFALINNQIFKKGDYVGDKKIMEITTDKVEIYDKGQIVTLTTK